MKFPKSLLVHLQDRATKLLDARRSGSELDRLARDLIAALTDLCAQWGQDAITAELEAGDELALEQRLAGKIAEVDIDGGGPRNAKPRQLVDCVIAALGLELADETRPVIALGGDVRAAVVAAVADILDVELEAGRLRGKTISAARLLVEPHHQAAFDKLAAALDERGERLTKQPKVPIDAQQSTLRALSDAREEVVGRAARIALDKATPAIAAADPEAAARLDAPVTLKLTPRDVAISRACDPRLPKQPAKVADALVAGLAETAGITWKAVEKAAKPYSASQRFAIGDVIEHPKFGRGTVTTTAVGRIEVEFADGKKPLAQPK